MSAGSQMLNAGWLALLDHHETPVTYLPKAGGAVYQLQALVSRPEDVANFGRNVRGSSCVLAVTRGAAPYAKDDTVVMDGSSYRVLDIGTESAHIAVYLWLGKTSIAGKQ